jgi:glycosyltransferase involved in cell wall biosynthesis
MKLFIILPAFNEAPVIGQVLAGVKKELKKINLKSEIVVIDDASWDKTAKVAKEKGATVLTHFINRGLGGALATGMEYARKNKAEIVLTMDSDGQHDPEDLKKVIKPILSQKADIVIGVREIKKMPFDRKIITLVSSLITYLFFGIYCSDTQSGFRVFNQKALKKIQIKTQRMEVSSEFFGEIKKNKLKFVEVPVRVIYTPYSRAKGQSNLNAFKILLKLILRLAR